MFEPGAIVYHKHLVFNDGKKDNKNKRPCVVLFSVETKETIKICTCPFTTNVNRFNKDGSRYQFIPEAFKNRNLNFVKIDNAAFHELEDTYRIECPAVSKTTLSTLFLRIKDYCQSNICQVDARRIADFINYVELFDQLNEKQNNQYQKKKQHKTSACK